MLLSNLVKEYILETGALKNMYARYYTLAVSGLREMHIDYSGIPQVAELIVNDAGVAQLPDNYIMYNRIAICDAWGNLHSLSTNNDICLKRPVDDCGTPIAPRGTTDTQNDNLVPFWWQQSTTFYADTVVNGEFVGNLFGMNGGQNVFGYFRIDEIYRTILFQGLWTGWNKIIIEYLGSMDKVGGDFIVHPYEVQSIKDWISWRRILNDRNYPVSEKAFQKQVWGQSMVTASRRFSAETLEDWYTAIRSTNTAVPRW